MKNPFTKSGFKAAVVTSITTIAAPSHLFIQSTADAIAHTEGYTIGKITGKAKSDVIKHRVSCTKQTQRDYADVASKFKHTLVNQFTAVEY